MRIIVHFNNGKVFEGPNLEQTGVAVEAAKEGLAEIMSGTGGYVTIDVSDDRWVVAPRSSVAYIELADI